VAELADQGQYYVEAISSSCPGSPVKSNLSTVNVSAKPTAKTLAGDLVCESKEAKVTVSASDPNVTYRAFIGNNPLGTASSGTGVDLALGVGANRLGVGSNNIIVKATSESCTPLDLGPAVVQVVAKPLALIGNGEPIIEVAEPKPFALEGAKSSPTNITYAWFSDDDFANKSITDAFSSSTQATVQAIKTKFTLFVTLTSPLACTDTAEVEVVLNIRLKVPNTFTPNGDGNHDFFEIPNLLYFKKATVEIFNQWGERVFKSEPGYPTPWDGKRGGQDLAESTYYYMIDLKERGYNNQSGYLTLVR
jgi:gliding motility-associated-like protein